MTQEQKTYGSQTTTEQRVRKVTDKHLRTWIVVETITARWYAEAYFDKLLRKPESMEELERISAPLLEA